MEIPWLLLWNYRRHYGIIIFTGMLVSFRIFCVKSRAAAQRFLFRKSNKESKFGIRFTCNCVNSIKE